VGPLVVGGAYAYFLPRLNRIVDGYYDGHRINGLVESQDRMNKLGLTDDRVYLAISTVANSAIADLQSAINGIISAMRERNTTNLLTKAHAETIKVKELLEKIRLVNSDRAGLIELGKSLNKGVEPK
jgi:hypothetical protein